MDRGGGVLKAMCYHILMNYIRAIQMRRGISLLVPFLDYLI